MPLGHCGDDLFLARRDILEFLVELLFEIDAILRIQIDGNMFLVYADMVDLYKDISSVVLDYDVSATL